jgi:hypothetical protein
MFQFVLRVTYVVWDVFDDVAEVCIGDLEKVRGQRLADFRAACYPVHGKPALPY